MLTREEIELEQAIEQAAEASQRPQDGDWDTEVMNGATARQDALKDRSGPEWMFTMERTKRVPRSARP